MSVNLPKTTSVGSQAFYRTALTSLVCPAATDFDAPAVDDCASLTSLRLDSVQFIGVLRCPALKKLAIPSVTRVDANAFQYTTDLETLVIGGKCVASLSSSTIPNESKLTVYVPQGLEAHVKAKIAAEATLYTRVAPYNGVVLKDTFIDTVGTPRSCVVSGASNMSFASSNSNIVVDSSGNCSSTVSYEAPATITGKAKVSVGGFNDLNLSETCAVNSFNSYAVAGSLADGSSATMTGGNNMRIYPNRNLNNISYINKSNVPSFTFSSCDENWYEIRYNGNTAYIPKPYITMGKPSPTVTPRPTITPRPTFRPWPTPDPNPGGGGGGSSDTPTVVVVDDGGSLGKTTDEGIQMTLKINGKETEVLLALNNFTYDYTDPETVTAITSYQLRKGPDASFGNYTHVKKGAQLTIIGRDGRWLKVDMGNEKIAYILEDMTTK